jgi:hypothetical protein
MVTPAFAVNGRQDSSHTFLAGAAVGGMAGGVQDVQSLCFVQPLRSVQTVGFPETILNDLNDWNFLRLP